MSTWPAALVVRGLVSLAVTTTLVACWGPGYRGAVPATNPVAGYIIEVSRASGQFEEIEIDQEGSQCARLLPITIADRTCRIATLLNPWTIGGEAYGELNVRRTPALDALIWRARANADPTVCAQGGLEGDFLAECEAASRDPDYLYESVDLRIRVPFGGALPSPTW